MGDQSGAAERRSMKMANPKNELNHAECIERDLKEWKKIFSLSEREYGYRINSYKGTQNLVFIPDMIEGKKVAHVVWDAFPHDCAVICNKRLFDKFKGVDMNYVQLNSACMYLHSPKIYPDEYSKVIRTFIPRNKDVLENRLIEEDDVEAFVRFLELIKKRLDSKAIEDYLAQDDIGINLKSYFLNINQLNSKGTDQGDSYEKDLRKDEFSVSAMKELWLYKKKEDGAIVLTGYKGNCAHLQIPVRIGKSPVTSIGDYSLSSSRPRATPEQKRSADRIVSVMVPEGICSLGDNVFWGNYGLDEIYLPNSVTAIGADAFRTYRSPESITIHAPTGSYAEQYAKEQGIPFVAETL